MIYSTIYKFNGSKSKPFFSSHRLKTSLVNDVSTPRAERKLSMPEFFHENGSFNFSKHAEYQPFVSGELHNFICFRARPFRQIDWGKRHLQKH